MVALLNATVVGVTSATETSTVLLPVSAALVGILVLGESFGTAHVAAFALAVAGLLLATWPDRSPQD